MADLMINQIQRLGGASIKEIEIGGNVLSTTQTIPKFQQKSDIDLFIKNNNEDTPEFEAVVFDLWSMPEIIKTCKLAKGQRRLDNLEIAISPSEELLKNKIMFIDPNTELFRFKFQISSSYISGSRVDTTRLSKIMNQPGFPKRIKELYKEYGTEKHNSFWKKLDNNKLLLSYVLWQNERSIQLGANIIIPPTPIIDGSNQKMMKIVNKINQISRELTFEQSEAFWSQYYLIHPNAFKSEENCQNLLRNISQQLHPNMLLILKFYRTKSILDDSVSRIRLGRFLSSLDSLKSRMHDYFAIMVLDTRADGFALMSNGVDIAVDPIGGVKDMVIFTRSKKGHELAGKEDPNINPYKQFGKYFHPDTREFVTINDLIEMIKPEGILPHNCPFCEKYHNRITNLYKNNQIKRDEWNSGRRIHNFLCRKEEDDWLRNAIRDGNERAVDIYLSQKSRFNKNLVDLLPTLPFEI